MPDEVAPGRISLGHMAPGFICMNGSQGLYRWSEPAERNQAPILDCLAPLLPSDRDWRVLEIGSGTGQHAVHFARSLPHVRWYSSDLEEYHATLNAYFDQAAPANLVRPLLLDAQSLGQFDQDIDLIYTANTLHIMSWENVTALFANAGRVLKAGHRMVVYGPFHVGGQATSDGNYRFDLTLSQSNPRQGIRHREAVAISADQAGFSLTQRFDLPANNQLLVFERRHDAGAHAR